jgi:hypothetical protein
MKGLEASYALRLNKELKAKHGGAHRAYTHRDDLFD